MSEQLTIGQSLTTEQVRNLPDGSEVEIYGSKTNAPFKIKSVLRDYEHKAYIAKELEYFGLCCDLVSLPPAPSEPSRRIEPQEEPAKPELPVWVITCDRCGTTYKNNERHACAASEPAKIVIQESGTISKSVYESLLPEHHTRAACEPAKPERQASEIEKMAAWALLGELSDDVRCAATGECADIDSANVLADACRQYIEAYDYAKSIGAISE